MKSKNIKIALIILTVMLSYFAYKTWQNRQKQYIFDLTMYKNYEVYINEKQRVSVDLTPEKYEENADYAIIYADSSEIPLITIPMTHNDGVLYSEVEIGNSMENSEVMFSVTYSGSTGKIKLFRIKSVSSTNIETEAIAKP